MKHKEHTLEGDGDWHRCKKLQQRLFDHSGCAHTSCSFGGAYQPALPKTFYGFSYLYDRVTAIGLLDGKPAQFGSQQTTLAAIERAGVGLCALDQAHTAERFREHQDASKASNFCGDVAYLTALLASLGFQDNFEMVMTNKIKARGFAARVGLPRRTPRVTCRLLPTWRTLPHPPPPPPTCVQLRVGLDFA